MKSEWITDYDMHTDKCYKRPGCARCKEPIFKCEDGKYHCVNCGRIVKPDDEMLEWFKAREETKVEIEDCFPEYMDINGEKVKMGCGGRQCYEVHYRRNPITLEWQVAGGKCTKCGNRFIV